MEYEDGLVFHTLERQRMCNSPSNCKLLRKLSTTLP